MLASGAMCTQKMAGELCAPNARIQPAHPHSLDELMKFTTKSLLENCRKSSAADVAVLQVLPGSSGDVAWQISE